MPSIILDFLVCVIFHLIISVTNAVKSLHKVKRGACRIIVKLQILIQDWTLEMERDSPSVSLHCYEQSSEAIKAAPTTSFQLPHIVTGEPASFAIERALPPAALLLPAHTDDVTLGERQLILIGLLEEKARLDQKMATPTALRHVLGKRTREKRSKYNHNTQAGYTI